MMIVDFEGMKIRIPREYTKTDEWTFINGHGVEYALVQYGAGDCITVCLETIYSKYIRSIEVEVIWLDADPVR